MSQSTNLRTSGPLPPVGNLNVEKLSMQHQSMYRPAQLKPEWFYAESSWFHRPFNEHGRRQLMHKYNIELTVSPRSVDHHH